MLDISIETKHPVCMPRLARLDAPGVLHHVMGRGIEKGKIFLDDKDREAFLDRLSVLALDGALDIYAWSLMPNHFHLLVKTRNRPLASSMRKILTGYAINFNGRHHRNGHLFQNRYKSIVCQEDNYLEELVRYIHLNLLRGGIAKNLTELNQSPWSGHSSIIGTVERGWQDTEYILALFGNPRSRKRNYLRYVEKGVSTGRRPELVGGGLIRSLGGWSEVLALRERGEKHAFDQRILGNSEFVQEIGSGLDNLIKKNLRASGQGIDIEKVCEKICEKYDLSMDELRAGGRRQAIVNARQIASWVGVRELGYSGAEVARYLGVTTSCVNRIISSEKRPDDIEDLT